MIQILFAVATAATPVPLEVAAFDNMIEVRGPRSLWKRREIRRHAEHTSIFIPGTTVRTLEVSNAKAYASEGGALIVVSPATAKLTKHVRFVADSRLPTVPRLKPEVVEAIPEMLPEVQPAETTPPVVAPEPDTIDAEITEPVVARLRDESPMGMVRVFGVVALLGVLGVVALWFRKARRKTDLENESIEIISVKTLGPKHRLAIVEAGGERLLIAATDSEVRLLSTLGYVSTNDEMPSTVDTPLEASTEDVAGLLKLRDEPAGARDFDTVLQSVNPSQYVA